jgi:hypothetical protein
MSIRKMVFILSIVIFPILGCLLPACQSTTTSTTPATTGGIKFRFYDADKNIISGVKVVSQKQPEGQLKVTGISTQDPEGMTVNDLTPGDYVFQMSKADYQGLELTINIVAGQVYNMDTTLNKLPEGAYN